MEYSEDFSKMQLEAMERLRQMQLRSKTAVSVPPDEPEAASEPRLPTEQNPPPCNAQTDIFASFFGNGIGTDKLLILLVLFMLYKNKADIKLILALGYLLL